MKEALKYQLKELAEYYETTDFLHGDPAQFMHRYSLPDDVEIIAFIAASLAFGERSQILRKIEDICQLMEHEPSAWIRQEKFNVSFPESDEKFYRFYSYADMRAFFFQIKGIIDRHGSIGTFIKQRYEKGVHPLKAIIEAFADCPSERNLIPKNMHSCCKRVNMFLRWMVRDNSAVDVGLWNWIDKKELIIPADTHVMQEALRLGIISKAGSSLSKAIEITNALRFVWPDDPCKGDFALFGWGINHHKDVKSSQKEDIRRKIKVYLR